MKEDSNFNNEWKKQSDDRQKDEQAQQESNIDVMDEEEFEQERCFRRRKDNYYRENYQSNEMQR